MIKMNLDRNQAGDWDNLIKFDGQSLLLGGLTDDCGISLILHIVVTFFPYPPYEVIIVEINRPWGEIEKIDMPWAEIERVDVPWGEIEPLTE